MVQMAKLSTEIQRLQVELAAERAKSGELEKQQHVLEEQVEELRGEVRKGMTAVEKVVVRNARV